MVGEDPDTTRANETIGIVVFEAGHGVIGGMEFEARLGGNTVQGAVNSAPYAYTFASGFATAPQLAVVTMAGVNGPNGAWAQTHGPSYATTTTLYLSTDEDQTGDSERDHVAEQVGYLAFGSAVDNEAPAAVADEASTSEDASVVIDVLGNDSDPDGDALSVSTLTQASHGAVVNNGANVRYTPNANYCGADAFTYTAGDGRGGSATATVSVTVACVNDPPVAANDAASTDENVPVTVAVLGNDTDPDGGTLVVLSVTQPSKGAVVNNGTSVTYTPSASFCGSDSFAYTASDGSGGSATATVNVVVICSNEPPVAVADGASTDEDASVMIDVLGNDSDPDGDALSVASLTQAANGAVVNDGANVRYTPAADYCGADGFTYTASDGNGGSATATVSVTVTCVNDDPVAVGDTGSVTAGDSVTLNVLANDSDVDGAGLTITSTNDGAHGTVSTDGTALTYVHDGSATTTDSFSYTIGDGLGGSATATVSVTVTPPAGTGPFEVVLVTVGGSRVTVNLSKAYASPVVVCSANYANNGVPVVTRVSNVGPSSFEVRLQNPSDGAVLAEKVSCLVVEAGVWNVDGVRFEAQSYLSTVTDSDGSWLGESRSYAQSYTSPVVLGQVMSENDPDWSAFWCRGSSRGDPPTATVLRTGKMVGEDPDTTRANETIGIVVFEAGHGVIGGMEFEARLGGNTVQGAVNSAPYAYTFASGFATAPQLAVVTMAGVNGPNGAWAQTHGPSYATTTTLYLSTDEDQTGDSERDHAAEQVGYLVFGSAVDNAPPVAAADGASTDEDASVLIDVLGNDGDPDGDALSVSTLTQASHGAVVNNASSVRYTPNADYCGADAFTYTAGDGRGGSATASVSVTVACVNDPPVALNDSATLTEGGSVSVSVLANDGDVDGLGLTIIAATDGAHGRVSTNGTTLTYVHDGSAATSDTFTYDVSDGLGGVDSATVSITVRPALTSRPNILLVIADDVGLDVVTDLYPGLLDEIRGLYAARGHANAARVHGRPASTPVILDRIAQQGMVFSSAWAQPVCSPTRAALITGLVAAKTGVTAPGSPMSANHTTFIRILKDQANYRAAMIGKWHLGTNSSGVLPQRAGFDIFKGHTGGAIEDFWNYSYHVQDGATTNPDRYRSDPRPTRSLPGIAPTTYAPVVQAADAIQAITTWEAEDPDRPWLAWLAFNEAHWPMHVPNADTMDAISYNEVTACGGVPGTNSRGSCSDKVLVRAMTNAMDTVVARVLDTVDALDPNTYVIFIGDNGTESDSIDNLYLTSSGRGKGSVYESGARVALAIRGPEIAAGSVTAEFVHATDLFATCLELAGVEVPLTNLSNTGAVVQSDSVSLAPVLRGTAAAVRDPNEGYILTETTYQGAKVGARNARYKVVCNGGTSSCGFFDLVADPLEEYPLSKPASCAGFRTTWSTADPAWHYCRLLEVVDSETGL
jgi:arylsulfatase A-like enzyme